jgi:hypothetical protein
MTSQRLLRAVSLSCTLVLAMKAPASAQSVGEAALDITIRTVPRDGSPSRSWARDTNNLPKGQTNSTYLYAGSPPEALPERLRGPADGSESLCSVGSRELSTGTLEDLVSQNLHVWKITSRAAGVTERGFSFDVEWVRYANATGTRPVASGRSILILADGQRHVLDLVHASGTSSTCDTGSVVLDVEARVKEDPTLADRAIRYDLWLVHTDPSGARQVSHRIQTGLHGMPLPFVFSPVRLPVPANVSPQTAFDAVVRINGQVRGRVRRDGAIVVELTTGRRAALEQGGAARVAMPEAGQGRKLLQLAQGETLEIELPALTGGATTVLGSGGSLSARAGSSFAGQGGPPDAVSLADGKLSVSFTRLFEGHKLSILLRAQVVE